MKRQFIFVKEQELSWEKLLFVLLGEKAQFKK
jgi:hypothetical protein